MNKRTQSDGENGNVSITHRSIDRSNNETKKKVKRFFPFFHFELQNKKNSTEVMKRESYSILNFFSRID